VEKAIAAVGLKSLLDPARLEMDLALLCDRRMPPRRSEEYLGAAQAGVVCRTHRHRSIKRKEIDMALRIGWANVAGPLQTRYRTRVRQDPEQTDAQYQQQWATWYQALQNQAFQDISQDIARYIANGLTHINRTISVSGLNVTPKSAVTISCAIGKTQTGDYSVAVQSFRWGTS
jgi:hypothetical protein